MQYFVLPKCCIAFNAKVGSTALAFSIVQKYYPDKLQQCLDKFNSVVSRLPPEFIKTLPESIQKTINNDKLDSAAFWQDVCVRTHSPDKPVLLAVRNPVERFASTVAYLGLDVDRTLEMLENDETTIFYKLSRKIRRDTHFLPQSIYAGENVKVYRFPDQIDQMCQDAEIDYPLPKINEGKHKKPVLTEEQIKRVKAFYANDVKLFESIK